MARQGRIYADFADSQWYAEPKRLARLGYLEARREPGRTRARTHYTLTESGRRALVEWAARPASFSKLQLEPAWRLLAADIAGEDRVLESLRALRTELADLYARLELAESVAPTIPHREKYLLLNHTLVRRILDAHREWLDDVERELQPRRRRK